LLIHSLRLISIQIQHAITIEVMSVGELSDDEVTPDRLFDQIPQAKGVNLTKGNFPVSMTAVLATSKHFDLNPLLHFNIPNIPERQNTGTGFACNQTL
jgi:hypothetical protein